MKKIISLLLVSAICVSLSGCIGRPLNTYETINRINEEVSQKGNQMRSKNYPKLEGSAVKNVSKIEAPDEIEKYEENKIKVDNLVLEVPDEERYEITYYYVTQDKYGNDVITVEFEFTNLSKWDRLSSVFDSVVSLYQNDIKLDDGLLTKIESERRDAARPGGTITGIRTYQLVDDESDVVFDMIAVGGYERMATGTLKIK